MNIIQKVRAVLAVRKAVTKIGEANMKAGITTTEFWLNAVTIAGTLYSAVQGFIPVSIAAKLITVLVSAYIIGRSLLKAFEVYAKMTATKKDDQWVANLNLIADKMAEVFSKKAVPEA